MNKKGKSIPVNSSEPRFDSFLKDEYLMIQSTINKFDDMTLRVKGWSITLSLAAIVTGFVYKTPLLFLLASLSALVFWFLEYKWRTYQEPFMLRSIDIEKYFSGDCLDIQLFQVGSKWQVVKRNMTNKTKLQIFLFAHVMFPHILIVLAGVLLYLLVIFGALLFD